MRLYVGVDLHANNNFVAMVDKKGKRVDQEKLPNDLSVILKFLKPVKKDIVGLVVESTYNWYWLVDGLMEAGYKVHLANPSAIQQYSGLKHADDKHDAFWLAQMLRLGILPEGYIYPKEERPIRDLLRKRRHLVKLRTSLMVSLQNIISRNCGVQFRANEVKLLKEDRVSPLLEGNEDLALAGKASKEMIDQLTRQIGRIEGAVVKRIELKGSYHYLLTLPGVGKILALTIMLETGPISRFAQVGNYVSYCRKVSSQWTRNEKSKGKGNQKNGNKYLAWAFSEAAEFARRHDEQARAYYNRKMRKTNSMVAHSALAHKLARAAYYLMRDQVPFLPEKLFC
jgi:transposase